MTRNKIIKFAFATLIAGGFISCVSNHNVKNQLEINSKNRSSASDEAQRSKIKISFVGDLLIHKQLYKSVMSSKLQNFSALWKSAIPYFNSVDYSYANLEGPVALGINDHLQNKGDIGFVYDGSVYSGTNMLFNYHPNLIDDIKDSGIDLVSTANNHSLDRGSIGIDKTIEALQAAKMNYIGSRSKSQFSEPKENGMYRITQIKDFTVGWVSCTEYLNEFKDKYSQILRCKEHTKEIQKIIKFLRTNKKVDLVILTPHWGTEYQPKPNQQQKTLAKLYLEAGADAVIGSHPHVLQPVESYKTQDGRNTFIAYSLGNFVSGQSKITARATAIVILEFEKNDRGAWISNYEYVPAAFNLETNELEIKTGQKEYADLIELSMSKKYLKQ